MKTLLERETFARGTFRSNRKNFPTDRMKADKTQKPKDSDFALSGYVKYTKCKGRGKKV